jgi:hypothetical protein
MSDADIVAAATRDHVIDQTWKCLSVPVTGKMGYYDKVFFDKEALSDTVDLADITFAPGVLEAMLSPTPPEVSFFQTLPSKELGLWGVYCLVLEKPGCQPLVYTGEASEKSEGIKNRWRVYDNPKVPSYREALPSRVRASLDNGFKITHKGVLAYYPIPEVRNRPRVRVMNYALEAMFSFMFWTMHSKTKGYQIGSCCPWDRSTIPYDGLCTHSSLNDPIKARLDLSPEQLEQLEAESAEWEANRQIIYYHTSKQRNKLTKEVYCHTCDVAFATPSRHYIHNLTPKHIAMVKKAEEGVVFDHVYEPCGKDFKTHDGLRGHLKSAAHMRTVGPPDEPRKPVEKTPKPERPWFCDICGVDQHAPARLEKHKQSKEHLLRLEKIASGIDVNKFRCGPCNRGFEDLASLTEHKKTRWHKKYVAKGGLNAPPPKLTPAEIKEKAIAEDRWCEPCERALIVARERPRHNRSAKHQKRVRELAAGVEYKFRCDVCDRSFLKQGILDAHLKSVTHKQMAEAAAAATA